MNKKTLSAIAAFLVAIGSLLGALVDTNTTTVTRTAPVKTVPAAAAVVATDGPDTDGKLDDPVKLTPKAQDVADTLAVGAVNGTNDLKPVENGVALAPVHPGPVAQLSAPFASDSVPGCRTRTLPTNWSHRAPGQTPTTLDLHYTAGPDIPNSRADVDGLTAFGSNPSARVSWHLNLDKDGNCDYNVPFREKAWTIAGLNGASINIEVHGKGEAPYLRAGGYRELARIFIDIHRSYPSIKLRLAVYRDCRVIVGGIGTHWMGGPCSGGHVDINPHDIRAVIATLRTYVAALSCSKRCHRVRELRAKHLRTHQRLLKNHCAHGNRTRKGQPRVGGYCATLRNRNAAVHRAAVREKVSLKAARR